jgi:hypothetical protein
VRELWAEFGRRLAERWVSLLVLPGLLYAAAAYAAHVLGQAHWGDPHHLADRVDRLRDDAAHRGSGYLLLSAVCLLLAAAAAGLAAQGLGRAAARVGVDARGAVWPAARLTARRRSRWRRAQDAYAAAVREKARRIALDDDRADLAGLDTAALGRARDRICLVEPSAPTWCADRMAAVDLRVLQAYDLDLLSAWPRLWIVAPEDLRGELTEAQAAVESACRLFGWAALYALLAALWWPALPVAAATALAAWRRQRAAVDAYAALVESTVDVHARDLATALGLEVPPGLLSRETGAAITRALQKPR